MYLQILVVLHFGRCDGCGPAFDFEIQIPASVYQDLQASVVVGSGIPADGPWFIALDLRRHEQIQWSVRYEPPVARRGLNVSSLMDVQSVASPPRRYTGNIQESRSAAEAS